MKFSGEIESAADLARRVGISKSQFFRWESGENDPPLETIVKLAGELGVDAGWLAVGQSYTDAPISNDTKRAEAVAALIAQTSVSRPPRAPADRLFEEEEALRQRLFPPAATDEDEAAEEAG